ETSFPILLRESNFTFADACMLQPHLLFQSLTLVLAKVFADLERDCARICKARLRFYCGPHNYRLLVVAQIQRQIVMRNIDEIVDIGILDDVTLIIFEPIKGQPNLVVVIVRLVSENQTLLTAVDIKVSDGYAILIIEQIGKPHTLATFEVHKKETGLFLIKNRQSDARG